MSTKELDDASPEEASSEEETQTLKLEVAVQTPSACERHVVVTISREDIDRYFDDAYSNMMESAAVPGFRSGRAPRKLVEQRYKAELTDQIKGNLLVDSLEQISEEHDFTAISEPDFDLDAVELPDEGPMTYEFDIEVRPEFDMPEWKGLKLKRPSADFSDEDIQQRLEAMLARHGQLVPQDRPAEADDYLSLNITVTHNDKEVASSKEVVVRMLPTVSFRDAKLEGFAKLMDGVKPEEKRSAEVTLSADAANADLRNEKVQVEFELLEVKSLRLPELNEDFLKEMGNFQDEGDLRDAIRQDLERQVEYEQRQQTRQQISEKLTAAADWDLPPAMLERQSERELERAIMELRRSGFAEADIRARENELRQNSSASTASALKEHFILERIAEEKEIDAEEDDYNKEVTLIAMQSGESPRRVRAQLEKRGMMDVLRNQIVERKVLELVESQAKFTDEPFSFPSQEVEAIDFAVGGVENIADVTEEKEEAAE